MEQKDNTERSIRSLFELGDMRRPTWGGGRETRAAGSSAADQPMEHPMEQRLKNVGLTDRHISLSIGAIEYVMVELRRLPGTEATLKEYEGCLYSLRQALAVLPAAKA